MKQARLFPKGPPDGDPDVHAPASREQLIHDFGRGGPRGREFLEQLEQPAPAPQLAIPATVLPAEEARRTSRDVHRSRRKREVRGRTISVKRMTKRELELGRMLYPELDDAETQAVPKPRTRDECASVPRPCPFVSCKHHLYLDVSRKTGAIKLNFPDLEAHELPPDRSCALDVADRKGTTLEEVGAIMNLTRERIRQIEVKGLAKLLAAKEIGALREFYGDAADASRGKRRLPVLAPSAEHEEDDQEADSEESADADVEFDAEEFASDALDPE